MLQLCRKRGGFGSAACRINKSTVLTAGVLESLSQHSGKIISQIKQLGHLARMPSRIPKICFFGWLSEKRLQGGPKKR